jgi:hypothetical protein
VSVTAADLGQAAAQPSFLALLKVEVTPTLITRAFGALQGVTRCRGKVWFPGTTTNFEEDRGADETEGQA